MEEPLENISVKDPDLNLSVCALISALPTPTTPIPAAPSSTLPPTRALYILCFGATHWLAQGSLLVGPEGHSGMQKTRVGHHQGKHCTCLFPPQHPYSYAQLLYNFWGGGGGLCLLPGMVLRSMNLDPGWL